MDGRLRKWKLVDTLMEPSSGQKMQSITVGARCAGDVLLTLWVNDAPGRVRQFTRTQEEEDKFHQIRALLAFPFILRLLPNSCMVRVNVLAKVVFKAFW